MADPAELVYCAPAVRPLMRVHIAEPGANLQAGEGSEPLTVCGLVMAWREVWVEIFPRAGDRVCGACQGRPQVPARQLTLVGDGANWHHADGTADGNAGGMA